MDSLEKVCRRAQKWYISHSSFRGIMGFYCNKALTDCCNCFIVMVRKQNIYETVDAEIKMKDALTESGDAENP